MPAEAEAEADVKMADEEKQQSAEEDKDLRAVREAMKGPILGEPSAQPAESKKPEASSEDREETEPQESKSSSSSSMEVEAGEIADGAEADGAASASAAAAAAAAAAATQQAAVLVDLEERSYWIPMRLSESERVKLHIAEGALNVSDYTSKVDVSSNDYFARSAHGKEETVAEEQVAFCKFMAGLGVCNQQRTEGRALLAGSLEENGDFFATCLEIARRYKIMNPDKMRTNYGKMLYLLMDNMQPRIQRRLGINLKHPLRTVHAVLKHAGELSLLEDPLLATAAAEVLLPAAGAGAAGAAGVARAHAAKKAAGEALERKYCGEGEALDARTLRLVVASVSDNQSFLRSNRGPVDELLVLLKRHFNPNVVPSKPDESLRIRQGSGGSKLSHSHETQFYFVLQSLTLWIEIQSRFFKLWRLAEEDLLDDRNGYRLMNTGQGLQRCQECPRVAREMSSILSCVKGKVGRWIGLSVVHLGDRDVPNAFIFIDKYTQISRILAPIVSVLRSIDALAASDAHMGEYVDHNFGGPDKLRKQILCDLFKHGFDGSGSNGGSCIDGRSTALWNWSSKLAKKPYANIFYLAGFTSFDGDFRE